VSHPDKPAKTRPFIKRAALWGLLLAFGATMWLFDADRRGGSTARPAAGWGQESAMAEDTPALAWLPMAAANACGLGASSCFKCHNGKRASAPASDPAKAPWHAQHAKVNNSCTGCHKGNPRVATEQIAHTKMEAKPRDDSAGSCGGCHTSDLAKVKNAYHAGAK
jgi:hypothetical protein